MSTEIVFTLTGPDRVGIVEQVTRVFLDLGGNVESSRMARLGGEFAILMLVSLPSGARAHLDSSFAPMTAQGYKVTASDSASAEAESYEGWLPYQIEVEGADHEGIIHQIASGLSRHGITIESAETSTSEASTSGVPLFSMTAVVLVSPGMADDQWRAELAEAAHASNVDVTVTTIDKG